MRTLSRIFAFAVLVGIVIVAVVSCCNFPFIPNIASYCVEIGSKQKGPRYAPWKSQGQFDTALKQVCGNYGTYCLKVKLDDKSDPIYPYHPHGSKDCTDCRRENIRTAKVTKSKVADDIAAGESVANDPNVTWRVASSNPDDIKAVLDALQQ
jgi:hypothetical protein